MKCKKTKFKTIKKNTSGRSDRKEQTERKRARESDKSHGPADDHEECDVNRAQLKATQVDWSNKSNRVNQVRSTQVTFYMPNKTDPTMLMNASMMMMMAFMVSTVCCPL